MDRRLTPANGRVAHTSLRGVVEADRFVDGDWARVAHPFCELLRAPDGDRDRQLLLGARVLVLERRDGYAFVQAERDGYVGYMPEDALGPDIAPTHRVAAPASHLYPVPDLKVRERAALSLGAEVRIVGQEGRYSETDQGLFVPTVHLKPVSDKEPDRVSVAESLLGTPYLWGGNTRDGLDCSALVQLSCWACGIACPGDSDQQEQQLGRALDPDEPLLRGDLVFWKSHVAMIVDAQTILHANAGSMSVRYEGLAETQARVLAAGDGPVTSFRRL